MAIYSTYSKARANLAQILSRVSDDREIVIISRRKADDVALIAASELASILETAHLLRSPKNAKRLSAAVQRALRKKTKPASIEDLRRNVGLHEKGKYQRTRTEEPRDSIST